nr:ATP-binding protein [uncultured Allomuricauda sp.]
MSNKVTITNYKCFNEEGGGFEKIEPINIIIGKNNSGKSSLIDLIQFLINPNDDFFNQTNRQAVPEVIVHHHLTVDNIERVFGRTTHGGPIQGYHFNYGRRFLDKRIGYKLKGKNKKEFISLEADYPESVAKYIKDLITGISPPLLGKMFSSISAERDIVAEKSNQILKFSKNGTGATNVIQQIINMTNQDSNLIEVKLLTELNKIVNPDINFKRILVQLGEEDLWEIFFIDNYDNRVALSKMGSGIKTIILVLLNLIVKPRIDKKNAKDYVFAFEELENNLHPSLQRRLYDYIKKYSIETSCYFFLTTHSNIVIDAFSSFEDSQLIHVHKDGASSKTNTILSYTKTKHIIDDLGIKASDILQTNGVIWVEGPSDRNYINRWIELLNPNLTEGLHYSIMFYGGRLLSNLSFDFEWLKKELIPLLRINSNAFVVIDRDGKGINAKLTETKKRINQEIGEDNCWITRGREIENYLTDSTINRWLKKNHGIDSSVTNEKNEKLEKNIMDSCKSIKFDYSSNKTIFSKEISNFISLDDLEILDLKSRMKTMVDKIITWND